MAKVFFEKVGRTAGKAVVVGALEAGICWLGGPPPVLVFGKEVPFWAVNGGLAAGASVGASVLQETVEESLGLDSGSALSSAVYGSVVGAGSCALAAATSLSNQTSDIANYVGSGARGYTTQFAGAYVSGTAGDLLVNYVIPEEGQMMDEE